MRNSATRDRLIAVFLLGLLVFSPPLLSIFDAETLVLGIPLLFLYLFGAWIGLVALTVFILRRGARSHDDRPEGPSP